MKISRIVAAVLCVIVVASANAQDESVQRAKNADQKQDANGPQGKRATLVKLSVDQEDRALKFARKHHSELADLLEQLRGSAPPAFSRGIREVFLASQRIDRVSEKWPGRFDSELQKWKMDSEIQLLTAKWVISNDPVLEQQIRGLLRSRQEAKIDELQMDRDRLAEKIRQLDEQIGMGTAELDAYLESEFEQLTKQASTLARAHRRTEDRPRTKDRSNSEAVNSKSQ